MSADEGSVSKGFKFTIGGVAAIIVIVLVLIGLGAVLTGNVPQVQLFRVYASQGTPESGYVPGAPRTAKECIDRGGTLANGGRGCSGYR